MYGDNIYIIYAYIYSGDSKSFILENNDCHNHKVYNISNTCKIRNKDTFFTTFYNIFFITFYNILGLII